jgi:tRNA uridine 5-carbamoylmethylation protein Kti12
VTVDVHNPAPQGSYIQDAIIGTNGDRYIIAMVGLPARGKTYISRKLARYLEFFHDAPTKVFNVGNYRRSKFGPSQPHSFFDPTNEEGMKLRNECAQAAMDDLKSWLTEGKDLGRVAIYDATNSTKKRRYDPCINAHSIQTFKYNPMHTTLGTVGFV